MLTPAERKALKARAHNLNPVVILGAKGLTPQVLKEVDLALKSHELIKVRAPLADSDERQVFVENIAQQTGAEAVQVVGRVFVLYRKNPDA